MYTLATFNANNFFLRYQKIANYPGDMSRSSKNEALDDATGFLPGTFGGYTPNNYVIWDSRRRELAAEALAEPDGKLPDILCLQEVENVYALRAWNEQYLGRYYPYSLVMDSHDPRNIDVGVLSRFPIETIRSHVDDVDPTGAYVFSRDCLEVTFSLPDGGVLTVLLNHLKSKLVQRKRDSSDAEYAEEVRKSHKRRQKQAAAVEAIIRERFKGVQSKALYAVVGDFNDTRYSPYLKPLFDSSLLRDVVRDQLGEEDSWTYFWRGRNRVSQIDFILGSKAFADRVADAVAKNAKYKPFVQRAGLAFKENASGDIPDTNHVFFEEDLVTTHPNGSPPASVKIAFDFPRFVDILDDWKNNISDHCPVKIWF